MPSRPQQHQPAPHRGAAGDRDCGERELVRQDDPDLGIAPCDILLAAQPDQTPLAHGVHHWDGGVHRDARPRSRDLLRHAENQRQAQQPLPRREHVHQTYRRAGAPHHIGQNRFRKLRTGARDNRLPHGHHPLRPARAAPRVRPKRLRAASALTPSPAPICSQLAPDRRSASTAARTSCPARSGTPATAVHCHPEDAPGEGGSTGGRATLLTCSSSTIPAAATPSRAGAASRHRRRRLQAACRCAGRQYRRPVPPPPAAPRSSDGVDLQELPELRRAELIVQRGVPPRDVVTRDVGVEW